MKPAFSSDSWWRRPILPAFLLVLGLYLSFVDATVRMDRFIYDYLSSKITRRPADDIVIIAIDSESLARYGQWPWPRHLHAELIDKLTLGGARSVGFDIITAEPDRHGDLEDLMLARAIEENGRVILPVFAEWAQTGTGLQLATPIPILKNAAAGLGHVDFELDSDGIIRRTYLLGGIDSPNWQAFALAILQTGNADVPAPGNLISAASKKTGHWMRDREVLLSFAGKPGLFPRLSYAEFMETGFDPARIKDKYVLVGATAPGLGDALPTPVSGESVPMSGVEINANLLDALMRNLAIIPLDRTGRLVLTTTLILVTLLSYAIASQRLVQLMTVGSVVLVMTVTFLLLTRAHVWFPPTPALAVIFLSYPLWAWKRLDRLVANLFRERERAVVTLHSIADGVITTDRDGIVQFMNPAAENITGQTTEKASGFPLQDIFPIEGQETGRTAIDIVRECLDRSEIVHLQDEAIFHPGGGRVVIVRLSAGPIRDQNGRATGAVLGITDITEKREALQKLTYQATHDPLTDLPNRSLLFDRLEQAIIRARRASLCVAVLFLDLDNFKKVNDQLGHAGGDRLLQMVSERMKHLCREGDTVARLGGDEFIVLLEGFNDTNVAATVADKFVTLLRSPFTVNSHELFTTGSIGIAIFPKDGSSADVLMKNADIAMYEAKKSGRNSYLFFSGEMNEMIQQRLQLEARLRAALKQSDLQLHYQPQIRLGDNRIVGVEALVRWNTDGSSYVPPSTFIPVAEESGLILPLSEWVLRTACRQARLWQDAMAYPLRMSVNISPRHFLEDDLPRQIDRIISETGINPRNLELEITESMIMHDIGRSVEIMRDFSRMGGTVAVDDFGTGYSSLAYLKKLPLDRLKIDRSFVTDIDNDTKNEGLAKTIITMGHGLGLEVIAEGVETAAQLAKLRELGCDLVQGYYYAKPLPANELTELLNRSGTLPGL